MVRAPCCEKMGLKKGPWTREEDNILINYVNSYGHDNWRALPKLAGQFLSASESILFLWSTIAARLPGRTDNEIKNVWHTHLKKRVKEPENRCRLSSFQQKITKLKEEDTESSLSSSEINFGGYDRTSYSQLHSPQHSYSEISSAIIMDKYDSQAVRKIQNVDEDFWSDIFSSENSSNFTTVERGYKYKSSMFDDMQFWFNVLTRGDELSGIYAPK
ncbi:hypothetical protein Ccrd_009207 [Cynara cardunculus var. scolymus]|uniref:Uncharacterized protein n=1 Tax=Cynara cardunculus var. scolymus TaxID=59895 RepID=A0A118K7K3_CYNCS|nr:hypothetical protein Ccrd_009207 [Cynara cardunculus var. scolymus]